MDSNDRPMRMPAILKPTEVVAPSSKNISNIGTLINQVEKKDRIKFFTKNLKRVKKKKEGFNTRFYEGNTNILIYLFLCIIVLGIIFYTHKKKYMTFISLLLVLLFSITCKIIF